MPAGGFQQSVASAPLGGNLRQWCETAPCQESQGAKKNYYLHKVGATRDGKQGKKNFKLLLL